MKPGVGSSSEATLVLQPSVRPAADCEIQWVPVKSLMGTPFERVARLAAARVGSFAYPARLLRGSQAKTGAMEPTRVLAAAGDDAPTAGCTPMTVDEVWRESNAAVDALRALIAAEVATQRELGGDQAAWLAVELEGWLQVLEPPRLGEIDPSVLAKAARPTDPELALVSLPAFARPVTTPPMPPLPQPPPPAAIPGWATDWTHAFSDAAYGAALGFFKAMRDCCRAFLEGVSGDELWRLLPRSVAFGIEHFQCWLAHLAAAGHVVVRRGERLELLDQSVPPPSRLNRTYIKQLFAESGCTDLALRDACLTHGFVYFTDLQPQVVLQTPLRSLFKSTTGFLSLHSEVLRMSSSGWFELTDMPRLDQGFFELCSCPGRYDPTGGVDRAYEERQRPIKDCGGPHKLLLTLAPPDPPLHDLSAGGRVPVKSTNGATGVRESKAEVRALRAAAAGGKVAAAAQRHTPGLRREAETVGERDTLCVGRAAAGGPGKGAASATGSWAGGRWLCASRR